MLALPMRSSSPGGERGHVEDRFDSALIAGLLGLLAHDLRNPLSALQSNVNFIGGTTLGEDPEIREAVADAVVSCEALGYVVENMEILGYGLTRAPARPLEPVRLLPFVEECVAAHRALAISHGARLELSTPCPDPALQVMTQRDLLRRALGNLLRNSIQHGPNGTVSVTLVPQGERVSVVVADQGPPLDPELFDVAFQAEGQLKMKSSARGRYGRGLGLYCARTAAHMVGATVEPATPPAGATHAMALSVAWR
mgnify:CR=1 FL=1